MASHHNRNRRDQAGRRSRRPHPSRFSRPRWQRRKAARPEEIVVAALDVFVERGFAAARLEEIARRAGVTKGTIYLYFADKEALFEAVVRGTILPNIARAEQAVAEHRGNAAELLGRLLRTWWTVMGETRLSAIAKLVICEAATFPDLARFYHREVVSRGRRLIVGVLERGIARGEFRPVDVPYATMAAIAPVVFGAIYKHSLHRHEPKPFDLGRYVETHIENFLRGLTHE